MNPFPEQYELIGFFESEPYVTDRDVPWFYNRLTFKTQQGEDSIVCEIEPGYGEIDLTWRKLHHEIAIFSLRDISALYIKLGPGDEFLTAKFKNKDILDFVLYLKPQVRVQWGNEEHI